MELSQPALYQQTLLDAVGGDDPAEVLSHAAEDWRALLAEAGDDMRLRPAPGEWSVVELLGHVTDAQLVTAARLRWIASEHEPSLVGYDQEQWVEHSRHVEADPERLLRLYAALCDVDVALWRRSNDETRARVGVHAERGRESFELVFRMIAGHHRVHLAQARRALAGVRATG